MTNPLTAYYANQAGTGISYFQGSRAQRGHGIGAILAKLFSSTLLPAFRSGGGLLAKQGLQSLVDVGTDLLSGENPKQAFNKRTKEALSRSIDELGVRLKQKGSGRKRKSSNFTYKKQLKKIKTTKKSKANTFLLNAFAQNLK